MGWIRKRPDRPSPWRAGYRGPDGREHSKSFERKVDAERWLRTELQKQDLGIWADVKELQAQLGHRSPVVTLSVYTHLFEDAYDSVMDRLDTDHRDLVRPKSGPNVVEFSERKPSQASDQGV